MRGEDDKTFVSQSGRYRRRRPLDEERTVKVNIFGANGKDWWVEYSAVMGRKQTASMASAAQSVQPVQAPHNSRSFSPDPHMEFFGPFLVLLCGQPLTSTLISIYEQIVLIYGTFTFLHSSPTAANFSSLK